MLSNRSGSVFLLAVMLMMLGSARAADERLPCVRVESLRRVFYNGQHNAFTDLVRFQGRGHPN
jgi:hypothetical protein